MATRNNDALFLDTSIQIARFVHRPEIQDSIARRLASHEVIVSGLVVRQEFKRRLLKKAAFYLLKQLNERKSFEKVRRHVADSLPQPLQRLKCICLQILNTVDEQDTDVDRTDRARLWLRDLIKNGTATAEACLTTLNEASGCGCARQPVIEKKKFDQYDFGVDRCSKMGSNCEIRRFLEDNRDLLGRFLKHIQALSTGDGGKSDELAKAEQFILDFFANPGAVNDRDPCDSVGDLLIAIESAGCGWMYTMNLKESRHLSDVLRQSLVYRPPNSDNEEVVYEPND
jgi:hypothetical protein